MNPGYGTVTTASTYCEAAPTSGSSTPVRSEKKLRKGGHVVDPELVHQLLGPGQLAGRRLFIRCLPMPLEDDRIRAIALSVARMRPADAPESLYVHSALRSPPSAPRAAEHNFPMSSPVRSTSARLRDFWKGKDLVADNDKVHKPASSSLALQ
jgi:hypothetical protein